MGNPEGNNSSAYFTTTTTPFESAAHVDAPHYGGKVCRHIEVDRTGDYILTRVDGKDVEMHLIKDVRYDIRFTSVRVKMGAEASINVYW